ncbi:MAG: 23S rRNA (guanosine(2251)-2'-O)-methyltransferase RlmB [Bacilli bacterium]|nr:23S rRNA (guanosine(2251)-2'-O)-methyltransferase RlmB [Bacilli bacterium]
MYVFGKNVALEILKKGDKIKKAYIYKDFNDRNIISALQKSKICINYCTKMELDKLANGNHQGIILSVPDYEYADISKMINNEDALIVILDHLEDPHNLGAIIRTCEAAGVNGIVIPKDRSVSVNSTVMKVSAGALENIKIACVTNLNNTIKYLKDNGFWIVGTDMLGTPYDKIDYRGKIAIVIGNEGSGMSKLITDSCDFIASIPMRGEINSLNASVATGIIVYEVIKCRK